MEGKVELAPEVALHSLVTTTVVVGAMVHNKPNFLAVAWACPATMNPPAISVCLNKAHYTNEGIKEAKAFSISICKTSDAARLDFVGIHSGKDKDKSTVYKSVPGKKTGAPLIIECPITIELSLMKFVDISQTHEIFIGKVESVFAAGEVLEGGKIDIARLAPVLFHFSGPGYYSVGQKIGNPWQIGSSYHISTNATTPQPQTFPSVDPSICVGCGTCLQVCPHELFEMGADGIAKFKAEKKDSCAHCEECVQNCAASAISMK